METGGVGIHDPARGESRTIRERAQNYPGSAIPHILYVDALAGTSNRRFLGFARALKAWQLPEIEAGDGYDFTTRVAAKDLPRRKDPPTRAEIERMLDVMDQRQIRLSGDALPLEQRRRFGQIITRFGVSD